MRTIAICDDNIETIKILESICKEFYENIDDFFDLYTYQSGEELLQSKLKHDIIFMDIEMDNLTGIETSKEIRKTDLDTIIILVSGFNGYKSIAYSLHIFDYIDKPIVKSIVMNVLSEAEKYCRHKKESTFMVFKTVEGNIKLDIDDIIYFEFSNRKIRVHTNTEEYEFYENMSTVANQTKELGFGRCHKGYIVNFRYIQKMKGTLLILKNCTEIPISKYQAKNFKDQFTKYLAENMLHMGY